MFKRAQALIKAGEKPGHKYRRRWGSPGHWNYDYGEGDDIHVPAQGDRYAMHFKVHKLTDTHATVSHGHGGSTVTMPRESLPHFAADLRGEVHGPKGAKDPDVAAVIAGKGKYLGKGDDGVVFKVGGNVVKASTTVPYQPMNAGHRTPEQARDMLKGQVMLSEKLRKEGVPGILPSKYVEHGNKAFQVKPYVDMPDKLTPEQLDQAREIVEALHAKGYTVNDTVQVGTHAGKVYLFDTGKVAKSRGKHDVKGDHEYLAALYRDNGQKYQMPGNDPKHLEAAKNWEKALDQAYSAETPEQKAKAKAFLGSMKEKIDRALDEGFDYSMGMFVPDDFDDAMDTLSKAEKGEMRAGHKYLRREPLPGGGFRYFYLDAEGNEQHADHGADHSMHAHWEQHKAGKREAPRHIEHKPSIGSTAPPEDKPEPKPDKPKPEPKPEKPPQALVQNLGVDEEGVTRVHHEHHGSKEIASESWSEELQKLFDDGMQRDFPPTGAAVALRMVPDNLLSELEGATDAERLASLVKRAPQVFSKLEEAFDRAAIAPIYAQSMISDVLTRRGWENAARAELIGQALGANGALVVRHHGQIADGAQNLAGGDPVTAGHVAAAVGLLSIGGTSSAEDFEETGGAFPEAVAALGEQAEAELDTIRGLLKAAKDDPSKAGELLSRAMASDAMHKLRALAIAYPGLQDGAAEMSRLALEAVPSVAPRTEPGQDGSHTSVFIAGEGGKPVAMKARYKLMEASDLIPSHDPSSFAPNPGYPPGVQERVYHRDKDEQAKVILNAQDLRPELLVNTNPDATNGAPIVLENGVVLGGNSRTMSSQLAYREGNGGPMRQYISDNAHQFGLKPEDVGAMVNPVLVRVVDPQDKSQESMQLLSRQLNESFTQAMDPRAAMVAMSRRFNEAQLMHMGETMEEGDTLRSYLKSSRAKTFIKGLESSGIIDKRNRNAYLDKKGIPNEDGVRLVERVVVGKVVNDADLLANTPQRLVSSLARSIPHLVRAEGNGANYNMRDDLHQAIDLHNRINHMAATIEGFSAPTAKSSTADFDATLDRVGNVLPFQDLEDSAHRALKNPRAIALAEVMFRKPGVRQMSDAFRAIADATEKNQDLGQSGLFGGAVNHTDVITSAIQRHLNREASDAQKWAEANQGKQDEKPQEKPEEKPQEKPQEKPEEKPEEKPDDMGQTGLFGVVAPPKVRDEEPEEERQEPNPNQGGLF